jgi:hypothetical protein
LYFYVASVEAKESLEMKMFFLGAYVTGAIVTFLTVGFLVGLGGREEDMWKPFVYAIGWPIAWPMIFKGALPL